MAILNFGTSPADFGSGFYHYNAQTDSTYIGPFVQEGVQLPNDHFVDLGEWQNATEIWISFHMRNLSTGSDGDIFYIYDENNEVVMRCSVAGTNCVWEYYDGAAYQPVATFGDISTTAIRQDVHILIDATGVAEVYNSGVLASSWSGDTTNGGARSFTNRMTGSSNNTGTTTFSAFFVSDEISTEIEYVQTKPASAGTYAEWNTTDFGLIDGTGVYDREFVASTTASDRVTYNQTDILEEFGNLTEVIGVGLSARTWSDNAGVDGLRLMMRSGGTDDFGESESLADYPEHVKSVFHLDPSTSLSWTFANAKAAEIGFQSENSVNDFVLLEGDEQSGTDTVHLEGDATDGNDHLVY